jgi:hypothetical protein
MHPAGAFPAPGLHLCGIFRAVAILEVKYCHCRKSYFLHFDGDFPNNYSYIKNSKRKSTAGNAT